MPWYGWLTLAIVVLFFALMGYACCALSSVWSRHEEMMIEANRWIRRENNVQGNENQDAGSQEASVE
jgi:hypothetical protein